MKYLINGKEQNPPTDTPISVQFNLNWDLPKNPMPEKANLSLINNDMEKYLFKDSFRIVTNPYKEVHLIQINNGLH